jgi:hypothetical protein
MSGRLAVRMTLTDGWEAFGDDGSGSSTVLRWRFRPGGAVLAAASLEALAGQGASPEDFAATAAAAPTVWRRSVEVERDRVPARVVIHDLDREEAAQGPEAAPLPGAPQTVRRSASVTWFLDDGSCLQLTLVTADLLALGDLGDAVRTLADSVEWEETA